MSELWDGLNQLARNFWWSWDAEATRLFRGLAPEVWEASAHSPVAILDTLGPDGAVQRLKDLELEDKTKSILARAEAYRTAERPWEQAELVIDAERGPVAYFCAEFGVHESLKIYAGGLGILAGDHCKSASDLGIPMIAVGLMYREGYFSQLVGEDARQRAFYQRNDIDRMGLELVCDTEGNTIQFTLPSPEGPFQACIWETWVGRVRLLLLDTAIRQNRPAIRKLTTRLYGGDTQTRIRQEILLGIGGLRALRLLGIRPAFFHMNEGHTAFLALELMREEIERGASFHDAMATVRELLHFTTHTPVPAGHDRFSPELVETELGWMREALGVDRGQFEGLGRVNVHDPHETYCMTVLALKLARSCNGVSALHGHISRDMWRGLWPDRPIDQVPIDSITNGVHVPTWMAPEMADLLDSHLDKTWRLRPWEEGVWDGVDDIPDSLFWAVHRLLKGKLIRFVQEAEARERIRRHQRHKVWQVEPMDPDSLTIGFARRFATYKRGDLMFRDRERAVRLLTSPDRPIQMIFAGKAHPHDWGGGTIIQNVIKATRDPELSANVAFIPDYDINVGKVLVQGVDVWLNNPRRPREASGTSGQKVPLNGGLNVSTVDGWWVEGYNGQNGWNIGDERRFQDDWTHDEHDSDALYRVLEELAVPTYYDRDAEGLPYRWIRLMKQSLKSVATVFSSNRMVRDYARKYYWPQ